MTTHPMPYAFTVALQRDGKSFRPIARVIRDGEERWRHETRASPYLPALSDVAQWLHYLADEIERSVFDKETFPGLPSDPAGEEVGP